MIEREFIAIIYCTDVFNLILDGMIFLLIENVVNGQFCPSNNLSFFRLVPIIHLYCPSDLCVCCSLLSGVWVCCFAITGVRWLPVCGREHPVAEVKVGERRKEKESFSLILVIDKNEKENNDRVENVKTATDEGDGNCGGTHRQ